MERDPGYHLWKLTKVGDAGIMFWIMDKTRGVECYSTKNPRREIKKSGAKLRDYFIKIFFNNRLLLCNQES